MSGSELLFVPSFSRIVTTRLTDLSPCLGWRACVHFCEATQEKTTRRVQIRMHQRYRRDYLKRRQMQAIAGPWMKFWQVQMLWTVDIRVVVGVDGTCCCDARRKMKCDSGKGHGVRVWKQRKNLGGSPQ